MRSIYVRDLDSEADAAQEVLAVDIESEETARFLVRTIAASFPKHGRNALTSAYWFVQGGRLREIWSEPDGESRTARRPRPGRTLRRGATGLVRKSPTRLRALADRRDRMVAA